MGLLYLYLLLLPPGDNPFAVDKYINSDPARKLSANLYDIYHCCLYSGKLLMMDRGTVRNMYSF